MPEDLATSRTAVVDEVGDYVPVTAMPGYAKPNAEDTQPAASKRAGRLARSSEDKPVTPFNNKPVRYSEDKPRNPYVLVLVFLAIAAVAAFFIFGGQKEAARTDIESPPDVTPPDDGVPPPEQPNETDGGEPQPNGTVQPPVNDPNPHSNQSAGNPPPITPPPVNPPVNTSHPPSNCPDECCSNADCAQGVCISGKCKECRINTDCMGIEVCCNNKCVECCSDSNCPSGMSCQNNICVQEKTLPGVATFKAKEYPGGICTENGKPILRMFGTSECPHCKWVESTYDSVVKSYGSRVVARRWVMDDKDDALTPQAEGSVPSSEIDVYFAFNPGYTTPTFVFGCRYYRIGTEYEDSKDLGAEARDFKAVIDKLLSEV